MMLKERKCFWLKPEIEDEGSVIGKRVERECAFIGWNCVNKLPDWEDFP